MKEITPQFYKYDAPIRHALLVLLLLLPVLVWCFQIYRDVFWLAEKSNAKWYASPYFYMLLSQLCFCADVRDPHGLGQTFCAALAMQIFYVSVLCGEGRPGDGLRV